MELSGLLNGFLGDPDQMNSTYNVPQRAVNGAGFDAMMNLGGLLMAAGQRMTPQQRAQYLSQIGVAGNAFDNSIYKSAQERLMGAQMQAAQKKVDQENALVEGLKQPGVAEKIGVDPSLVKFLTPSSVGDILEKKLSRNPVDDRYKEAMIKAAETKVNPESTYDRTIQTERAKSAVKSEIDAQQKGASAAMMMPQIDRATTAYEGLAKNNAIGPYSASGFNRTLGGMTGQANEKLRQDYEAAQKELELAKAQISMKGQGSITDSERKILSMTLPRLDAADPSTGLETLRLWKQLATGRMEKAGNAPQAQPSPQSAMPEGARQAPDGHWYVQQNGKYFRVN